MQGNDWQRRGSEFEEALLDHVQRAGSPARATALLRWVWRFDLDEMRQYFRGEGIQPYAAMTDDDFQNEFLRFKMRGCWPD